MSKVAVWSGITRCEMNRNLEIRVPPEYAQVSRFEEVLVAAGRRRRVRREWGGRGA